MKLRRLLGCAIALGGVACGSNGSGSGANISARLGTFDDSVANGRALFSAGQAGATGLTSLKYAIQQISICEELTTNGTAFNNQSNCLSLYQGVELPALNYDPATFNSITLANAARASDTGFIDLLDPTARAALSADVSLSADHAHAYNWGIITWYLPIKLTASIPMNDGTTFRTLDGASVRQMMPDGYVANYTEATTAFDANPTAREAVVVHGNGGTWFRFQNPFVITQADIDAGEQFVLDLTFNPDGLVKGFKGSQSPNSLLHDNAGNGIDIPMLDLTPVAHKASEHVVKSTYRASISSTGLDNGISATDRFDLRYELYSLESDAAQTVYGVDVKTLVNTQTARTFQAAPKVSFLETAADGSLTFQGWDHGNMMTGFRQQTTVGASSSATLHCGGNSTFAILGCGSPLDAVGHGSLSTTFTLSAKSSL